MERSRLKNIVNKSKEIGKGDFFEMFKKDLPSNYDFYKDDNNYRLKEAWESYGKPKSFEEAQQTGLVLGNVLASIGYNEDTDDYEYLNKGYENDSVNRDIRVWEEDMIPLVQELKNGGYLRVFDEEKNFWTYTKNPQKKEQYFENEQELINKFKGGGKTNNGKNKEDYYNFLKSLPENLQKGNQDDGNGILNNDGYRMELLFQSDPDIYTFQDALNKGIFNLEEDGHYHAPSVIKGSDGNYDFLKSSNHPTVNYETNWYKYHPAAEQFRKDYELVTTDEQGNPLTYYKYIKRSPEQFKKGGKIKVKTEDGNFIEVDSLDEDQKAGRKSIGKYKGVDQYMKGDGTCGPSYDGKQKPEVFRQGGQMNVIPEGALHARKNNMEGGGKDYTHKGIPVMTKDGEQVAEIEKEEIIFNKSFTDFVEEKYKAYKEDKDDDIAISVGKRLVKEIFENTDDRTGLIDEIENKL